MSRVPSAVNHPAAIPIVIAISTTIGNMISPASMRGTTR